MYYTRQTGRTANELSEYFFWMLRAFKDGKIFKNAYDGDFPYPFHTLPRYLRFEKEDATPSYEPVPAYPLSATYYTDYRFEIQSLCSFHDVEPVDVCIHMRLDDILNDMPHYTLLPFSWYTKVLEGLEPFKTLTIVSRPIDGE